MFLFSDIGNSRIKLAVFSKDENPIYYTSCEHNIKELLASLSYLKNQMEDFDKIFYSSVASRINDMFEDAVNMSFNREAYRVTHRDINLKKNRYIPENSVGIDRLLSTYASLYIGNKLSDKEKYASIVVDMGSATTISVMLSDLEFLGGMIMPGMKTSYKALSDNTSLPFFDVTDIDSMPSPINNTVKDALISGMVYNALGAIDFSLSLTKKLIKDKYNLNSKVFFTGGLSNIKLISYDVYPYLVLQGIYFVMKNVLTLF